MFRKLSSFLFVFTLCASLVRASSPTPPVEARLEADGRGAVRLIVATTASGDYKVTVRKTGAALAADGSPAPKPLTEGIVRKDSPVIVRDALVAEPVAGDAVHVNYQVEVVSAERGYHGFVGVDQGFVVDSDGTLKAVTFEQELAAAAGPAPMAAGKTEISAGDPTPEPRQ